MPERIYRELRGPPVFRFDLIFKENDNDNNTLITYKTIPKVKYEKIREVIFNLGPIYYRIDSCCFTNWPYRQFEVSFKV